MGNDLIDTDSDLEDVKMQTINKAKLKTRYVERFGSRLTTKMENDWIFIKGLSDNNFVRLDFWASVGLQDKDAMAIIDSYEERAN